MNIDHNKVKIYEAFGVDETRMESIFIRMDNWVAGLSYAPKDSQMIEYVLSICNSRQEELCSMLFLGMMQEVGRSMEGGLYLDNVEDYFEGFYDDNLFSMN